MIESSRNVRRAAAIALLVLCASAVSFAVAWPAVRYIDREYAERARLAERVARARGRATELPRIEAVAAEQAASPVWGRVYRNGDPAGATADFERDVRAVLGPKFSTAAIEHTGPTASGDLTELGVRLRASITAGELADVLQRIESAPQLLRTQALKVASPLSQRDDRNELLDTTLEVVGYWVGPGRPPQ
jgi:hypothetical protein